MGVPHWRTVHTVLIKDIQDWILSVAVVEMKGAYLTDLRIVLDVDTVKGKCDYGEWPENLLETTTWMRWGEGLIRLLWVDSLKPARKLSCNCSKGRVGWLCWHNEIRWNVFWTRLWHSNTRKTRTGSKGHLIRLHQP